MRPLTGSDDGDSPAILHIRHTGFRLEVGMFLDRCFIFPFHDDGTFLECLVYIPAADDIVMENIARPFRMQYEGIVRQSLVECID